MAGTSPRAAASFESELLALEQTVFVHDDPDGASPPASSASPPRLPGEAEFVGLLPTPPSTVQPPAAAERPRVRSTSSDTIEGGRSRVRALFSQYLLTPAALSSSTSSPQPGRASRLQQEADDLELTYREFCMLMKGEWDAEDVDIRTMWEIPGFTDRRNDISRQHVLKESTFRSKMEALGLKQRFAGDTGQQGNDGASSDDDLEDVLDDVLEACCGCCGVVNPQKHCCLKNSSSGTGWRSVLSIWDTWLLLLLGVVVVTIPLRIGFEITASTDGNGLAWLVVDIVMDASFILDMIKNFTVLETLGGDLAVTEEHREEARRRYLHRWFIPDVIASLPITYIQLALESNKGWLSSSKLFRLLRLIRLVKMLRLSKLQVRQTHALYSTLYLLFTLSLFCSIF